MIDQMTYRVESSFKCARTNQRIVAIVATYNKEP